jgi:hypothetical protein
MLRELRTSRNLTLAVVARQAGCAESLLSYVESGQRQLQPWLAKALDALYRTGGAITTLASGAHTVPHTGLPSRDVLDDVLVLRLPEGGATMPVSRRDLLAGLSIGAIGGALADQIDHLLDQLGLGDDAGGKSLAAFERAFAGFSTAARSLPPARLIDGMTGQVALLDRLRRRASASRRGTYAVLQARRDRPALATGRRTRPRHRRASLDPRRGPLQQPTQRMRLALDHPSAQHPAIMIHQRRDLLVLTQVDRQDRPIHSDDRP